MTERIYFSCRAINRARYGQAWYGDTRHFRALKVAADAAFDVTSAALYHGRFYWEPSQ